MSNAKLKEQIEAAKIALVHSAELGTPAHSTQQSATITQIDSPGNTDRRAESSSVTDVGAIASNPQPQTLSQNAMPLSDFEILEARLQELETQIKNQQRDLHTLLQKLRDITAKSKPLAQPKRTKVAVKWVFGFLLFAGGLAVAYLTLGVDAMMQAGYIAIGQMVALIDMLLNQF